MKKVFTLLTLVTAFNLLSFAQTQVPNGGFETWTDSVTAGTWNSLVIPGFPSSTYFVHRTSVSHTGSFAAKIETKIAFSYVFSGIMTLGTINILTQSITGGFEISDKPTKLIGYYQYSPALPGDTMAIAIYFTKWNTGTLLRDTLFTGWFKTSSTANLYTLFEIPITYTPSNAVPDTMNIIAASSAGKVAKVGSALYIDDLSFDYTPVDISENSKLNPTSVYPNPSTGLVTVCLNSPNSMVKIYNIVGEEIFNINSSLKNININLLKQPNGVYLLEVNNGISRHIQKLVISK